MLSLAANPISSIGGVYQKVQDDGVITNVIDVLNPRALSILPPTVNLDSTLRLEVQTRARWPSCLLPCMDSCVLVNLAHAVVLPPILTA